ncbi:MAG: hexapeptide transferase, partial [Ferruginibacter sp.]|nr:hexapeptide transferase [Ferruginibacter sp.]
MIICGAGGHAGELYHCFHDQLKNFFFFDNLNLDRKEIFGKPVLHSIDEIKEIFKEDNRFLLGVGGVKQRADFFSLMKNNGGEYFPIFADSFSNINSSPNFKADIFPYSFIGPNVKIGEATLINTRSNIHHDTVIGQFCDIAPAVTILGSVLIGDYT